jgi:hypothetical protein
LQVAEVEGLQYGVYLEAEELPTPTEETGDAPVAPAEETLDTPAAPAEDADEPAPGPDEPAGGV